MKVFNLFDVKDCGSNYFFKFLKDYWTIVAIKEGNNDSLNMVMNSHAR
jgi:hypothetical protein